MPSNSLFTWLRISYSHGPEYAHLKRYVAEFGYRLNRRSMETTLFDRLVRACLATQTIIYKELIAPPEQA
jgi:hypothetical protein